MTDIEYCAQTKTAEDDNIFLHLLRVIKREIQTLNKVEIKVTQPIN